jgi:hypothetical protein
MSEIGLRIRLSGAAALGGVRFAEAEVSLALDAHADVDTRKNAPATMRNPIRAAEASGIRVEDEDPIISINSLRE